MTKCTYDRDVQIYRVKVLYSQGGKSQVSGDGVSFRALSVGSIVVLAGDMVH